MACRCAIARRLPWPKHTSATDPTPIYPTQEKCFSWPVTTLRWRAGAGFATGAHVASGKEAAIQVLHTFYQSVQMVPVGNEPAAACLLGACATNHNESAPTPTFTAAEEADARSLAVRLATLASSLRGLIEVAK